MIMKKMNKRGVSTLIEVAAFIALAVFFLSILSNTKQQTPTEQHKSEINHNIDWQTNGAEQ